MHARRLLVALLAVLIVAATGPSFTYATNADAGPGISPLLVIASISAESSATVSVSGKNFTPGGEVFVAVYDQWGFQVFDNRWTTATETIHGANGSQDPANGFVTGGTISQNFGAAQEYFGPNGSQDPAQGYVSAKPYTASLCGTAAMARAYDLSTEIWSNVLDVSADC